MTFAGGHEDNATIKAEADALAAANPTLCTIETFGDSGALDAGGVALPAPLSGTLAGEQLWAYKITDSTVAGPKPAAVIVGGAHALELNATYVAHQFAQDLVGGAAGTNLEYQHWLKRCVVWIVPIANPDGRELIKLMDPHQPLERRKTVVNEFGDAIDADTWPDTAANHGGVDLNRNYPTGWANPPNETAGSDNKDSRFYRGTSALCVPESANMAAHITAIVAAASGEPVVVVDLHSPSEKVAYPWAYTATAHPRDADMARFWGVVGEAADFPAADIGPASTEIYLHNGAFLDSCVGAYGCLHAGMIEHKAPLLSSEQAAIDEYMAKTRAGLEQLLRLAEDPDTLSAGPTTSALYAYAAGDGRVIVYGRSNHATAVDSVEVSVSDPVDTASTVYLAEPFAGAWGDPEVWWVAALPAGSWVSGQADLYARAKSGSTYGETRARQASDVDPAPDLTTGKVHHHEGPDTYTGSNATNLGTAGETITAGPFFISCIASPTAQDGTFVARRDGNTKQYQFAMINWRMLAVSRTGWGGSNLSNAPGATTELRSGVKNWVALHVNSSGQAIFYRRRPGTVELVENGVGGSGAGFAQQSVDTLIGARFAGAPSLAFAFTGEISDVYWFTRLPTAEERRLLAGGVEPPAEPAGVSPTAGGGEVELAGTAQTTTGAAAGLAVGRTLVASSGSVSSAASGILRGRTLSLSSSSSSTSSATLGDRGRSFALTAAAPARGLAAAPGAPGVIASAPVRNLSASRP